ncbi:hypothetical protein [Amorphus orientalis]|uniref:Uncharacterized protein n=1 Tax=Amorphus orientalis TaxID=649198 RepID=A0AAE3VPF5_9HYPH|nr:hypothetical protein [Amorphus orientalis]MDQ0316404.1 hypothetical protein [Amorphus orientalis]
MNKRTRKIIQDINDSVPKELRDRLFKREYVAPDLRIRVRETVAELRKEAEQLEGEERDKALKEAGRLQNMIDAGFYDATQIVVDPEVAKEVDAYVERELDKAIAEGRIPHPKNDRDYQSYIRKLKQHGKRKQRSEKPAQ